jgi:D-hexose-6-phosphate mutarotase
LTKARQINPIHGTAFKTSWELKNKKAARTAAFLRLAIAASSLIADFSVKTLQISH